MVMKKKHFIILLLFLLPGSTSPNQEKGAYILLYHTFLNKSEYITDVAPEKLNKQLLSLKNNGFTFVSFTDILNNKISGTRNIMISIDDGNRSVYRVYKNILKPMGIKPLLAIFTHSIERTPALMTWKMIRELSDDGCDIASHGHVHYYLDEQLYKTNRKAFMREIVTSKKILEEKLQKRITVFMYPYGRVNKIARIELKNAGYTYAFTLKWGFLHVPLHKNNKVLELPRYMVMGNWERIYYSILRREKMRSIKKSTK